MSLLEQPDGKKWAARLGLIWIVAGAGALGAAELPPLPQGLASFGAATLDQFLYVYGGHSGATHVHSVDDQSRRFLRLDLDAPKAWEDLGEVQALQGVALVPFEGAVCRVGGMQALNRRGEPEDLVSIAEVACWSPAERRWKELPPLPAPRSTHDAVAYDGKIYVAGGWRLGGQGTQGVWADDLLIFEPERKAWRACRSPSRGAPWPPWRPAASFTRSAASTLKAPAGGSTFSISPKGPGRKKPSCPTSATSTASAWPGSGWATAS